MTLSEFNPTWFEGTATATITDVPATWDVAIGGHGYLVEPSLYRRSLVPVQRDARDDNTEPGEQTLSPTGIWRRSQSDWSLGAGQLWLDESGSTRQRFYRSLGIDAFSDDFEATLTKLPTERRSSANTNLRLVSTGDRLYYADGAAVAFSDTAGSETASTWSFTAATGLPGGNVLDMVSWGSHVIILGSDNSIYGAPVGTAAQTLLYNPVAALTRIWVALGRLFGSANNGVLYEITNLFAGGAESTVFTHPNTNYRITDLIGTPTGIYFGGSIGRNGEIRYTKVNTAGSGFDAPYVVAEFLDETVNCLASAGTNLIIGTSQGWRYSPLEQGSPALSFGPVVTTPGAVAAMAVGNVEAETFVWFTWGNIYGEGVNGLGIIRPSRFAQTAVPAYMSNVYAESSSAPITVATIRGKRYFGLSGDGFYGESDNFVEDGWLETGRIRAGILDTKVFADLQWRTLPLPLNAQVDAEFTAASGQTYTTPAQGSLLSTESTVNNLGPIFSEWGEIQFNLRRGGLITAALYSETVGGSASTPDNAAYAVTDLQVVVKANLPSWVPGGLGRTFLDQWGGAGNQGWVVGLDSTGHLVTIWSNDGTATNSIATTAVASFLPNTDVWLRFSLDVNNGAGGKTATFESSVDGSTWSLLQSITQAGTTSIFDSTATVRVGGLIPGAGLAILRAALHASIGGADVLNPNFEIQTPGAASFADAAGRTWTINAPAEIALVAGSDASAPTLTSWVLRAIPSPSTTTEFLVPILLRTKLQPHHGPIRGVDVEAELEYLGGLVATQAIVKYQEGRRSYDVHVVNFEVRGEDWNRTENVMETTVLVQMHTLR